MKVPKLAKLATVNSAIINIIIEYGAPFEFLKSNFIVFASYVFY